MGIRGEIEACRTTETGFASIDDRGEKVNTVDGSVNGGRISQVEVVRRGILDALYTWVNHLIKVNIIRGRTVSSVAHSPEQPKAVVTFEDGGVADYDVVIGANGSCSHTKDLLLGAGTSTQASLPRDAYCARWTMPAEESDTPHARVQHAHGGRVLLIRPVDAHTSSCYLLVLGKSHDLDHAEQQSQQPLKAAFLKSFLGLDGLAPRALGELVEANDFWGGRLAQVKIAKWYNGRCCLIGDAAFAPSQLPGAGAHMSILAAYHLAGELSKNPRNSAAAMEVYDARIRAYVESEQVPILGGYVQTLLYPENRFGESLVRLGLKFLAWCSNPIAADQACFDPLSTNADNPSPLFPRYPGIDATASHRSR